MPITAIELYETLRPKLGDKETRALIIYIDEKLEKRIKYKNEMLASKVSVANANVEIQKIRTELMEWMCVCCVGLLASIMVIVAFILK